MSNALVKGKVIQTRFEYLKELQIPNLEARILADLHPDFRAEINKGILAVKWYGYEYFLDFLEVIERHAGTGDYHLVEESGKYSAKKAFTGLYKVFAKFGSPEFIIKRAPTVWRHIANAGTLVVEFVDKKKLICRLVDFPIASDALCHSIKGWLEGVLEVSGGKQISVSILDHPSETNILYSYMVTWT